MREHVAMSEIKKESTQESSAARPGMTRAIDAPLQPGGCPRVTDSCGAVEIDVKI